MLRLLMGMFKRFLLSIGLAREQITQQFVVNGLVTLQQAYEGIVVTGGTGAGKSSGPMREAILNLLHMGAGFLVLTAKSDEIEVWERYCKQTGRKMEPFGCFNFLQHEAETGGIQSARGLLTDLYDAINPGGKGDDPFWPNSARTLLSHALSSCYLGKGEVSIHDLVTWIYDLPTSEEQWNDLGWRTGFIGCCHEGAMSRGVMNKNRDFDNAFDYVRDFWPKQDQKVRGSIVAEAMTVLEPFLNSEVYSFVNGESTITPSVISEGGCVVVGTPVLKFRESGRLINIAWKLATQRHLLRCQSNRPVCICTDEANWFAVAGVDALVQSVARSSKIVNLMAFQNTPLLKSSLGGDMAETEVNGWLANFQNVIACQNACPITNKYFSTLVGEEMQLTFGGSSGGEAYDPVKDWLGEKPKGFNASWHQHMMPILPPNKLTTLKKGGPSNNFKVQAYVYCGGRKINGRTFALAEFSQK